MPTPHPKLTPRATASVALPLYPRAALLVAILVVGLVVVGHFQSVFLASPLLVPLVWLAAHWRDRLTQEGDRLRVDRAWQSRDYALTDVVLLTPPTLTVVEVNGVPKRFVSFAVTLRDRARVRVVLAPLGDAQPLLATLVDAEVRALRASLDRGEERRFTSSVSISAWEVVGQCLVIAVAALFALKNPADLPWCIAWGLLPLVATGYRKLRVWQRSRRSGGLRVRREGFRAVIPDGSRAPRALPPFRAEAGPLEPGWRPWSDVRELSIDDAVVVIGFHDASEPIHVAYAPADAVALPTLLLALAPHAGVRGRGLPWMPTHAQHVDG